MSKKILIKIKNLSKKYPGPPEIHALRNVNLEIYEGEILSLLGINGAGKTTLSSIISTLHPATSGKILFQNTSIYDDIINFRKAIGIAPQKPNLDEMLTLKQNLEFAGRYFNIPEETIQKRCSELMKKFDLEKYADAKGSQLSGGYKQRFIIARTLMHSPKLVILDEPTSGLDPHIRRNLWNVIKELKKDGVTILLTTHYLEESELLSDRVCILDKGIINIIDTPENLKKKFHQSNLENVFIELLEKSSKDKKEMNYS